MQAPSVVERRLGLERSVSRNARRQRSRDRCSNRGESSLLDAQVATRASGGESESKVGSKGSPGLPLTFPWKQGKR